MNAEQAVAAIDAISVDDPEAAHSALDSIVLELAPVEVQLAAMRLYVRLPWVASA